MDNNEWLEERRKKIIERLDMPFMVEELRCDLCDKHLGWASTFDLEGSYFVCDECKAEHIQEGV